MAKTVRVLLFASLKEKYGFSEREVEIEAPLEAAGLWQKVVGEPLPSHVLVAVNQTYASPEQIVRPGDEVAFFPPVTGG